MSDSTEISDELAREIHALSLAALQGTAGDDELSRLDLLVCENAAARRYLAHSMQTCGHLRLWAAAHAKAASACSLQTKPAPDRGSAFGLLGRITRIAAGMSLSTALTWMVLTLCACGVILTFAFIALIEHGGNAHVDRANAANAQRSRVGDLPEGRPNGSGELVADSQLPPEAAADAPPKREGAAQAATVARLIHAYDCHWAIGSHSPRVGDDLAPGRKLVLASGLAEVLFQSGVRAVLQGPATMEIESKTSAFLRQGRVAVTVIDPDTRGFKIDAPGMKYTDLGTEFGVWVKSDGTQEMHVFRGQVRAEVAANFPSPSGRGAADAGLSDSKSEISDPSSLILSANQAVRLAGPGKPLQPIAANEKRFSRVATEPAPFPLFGTGAGLDRFASDPHWEIARISTDAPFYRENKLGKPQPAVVIKPAGYYVPDRRDRFQWVSTAKTLDDMPGGCRVTYRTRFDLTGFDASTARIEGRIAADDFVAEIRLNGGNVPVKRVRSSGPGGSTWQNVVIDGGFVDGDNSLEIVVENVRGYMAMCVEIGGRARPRSTYSAEE